MATWVRAATFALCLAACAGRSQLLTQDDCLNAELARLGYLNEGERVSTTTLENIRAECARDERARIGGTSTALRRAQERYRLLEQDLIVLEQREAELTAEIRRLENQLLENIDLNDRQRRRIIARIDEDKALRLAAEKRGEALRRRMDAAAEDLAILRAGAGSY